MIRMELCRENIGPGGRTLDPTIVERFEVDTEREKQEYLARNFHTVNGYFYREQPR